MAAENMLQKAMNGHYKEFVVPTHGVSHAGKQRLVVSNNGRIYYTSDHYESFTKIN